MSPRARRALLITAGALVAWYVCVLLLWAVQPLSDAVPIGIDYSPNTLVPPKGEKQISQTVDCNSLFASSAKDSSPLPSLPVQPKDRDPLKYSRGACSPVQRDARIVLGLNTLFVLVALAGLVVLARRLTSHPLPPPLPTEVAPPLTA